MALSHTAQIVAAVREADMSAPARYQLAQRLATILAEAKPCLDRAEIVAACTRADLPAAPRQALTRTEWLKLAALLRDANVTPQRRAQWCDVFCAILYADNPAFDRAIFAAHASRLGEPALH